MKHLMLSLMVIFALPAEAKTIRFETYSHDIKGVYTFDNSAKVHTVEITFDVLLSQENMDEERERVTKQLTINKHRYQKNPRHHQLLFQMMDVRHQDKTLSKKEQFKSKFTLTRIPKVHTKQNSAEGMFDYKSNFADSFISTHHVKKLTQKADDVIQYFAQNSNGVTSNAVRLNKTLSQNIYLLMQFYQLTPKPERSFW